MLTCSARGLAMSEPLTNCRVTGGGHFAHFMHEWKVVGPLTRKPLHKRGVEVVWIEVVDVVSDEKGEFAIVELELVDGKLMTGSKTACPARTTCHPTRKAMPNSQHRLSR